MQTRRRSKTDAFLETALACSFGSLDFLPEKQPLELYHTPPACRQEAQEIKTVTVPSQVTV
jgi:hypothetical protein